jgi:N-methylhydantoinase A
MGVSIRMTSDDHEALCIGVDVGGTFTDVVLSDGASLWTAKAPSTPGRIGDGVLAAVELVAVAAGSTIRELLPRVERFGLGTTAVTNTLASRAGLRVGLITTAGFEHLIPMAKGRLISDNGWMMRPPELVTRERIVGVAERIDRNGTVLEPLVVADVVAAARHLVDREQVEAIAVSFLWSFVNQIHEEAAVAAVRAELPGVTVVGGAELLPVIREYERTTFAILNAYTSRALDGLGSLITELARLGLRRPPLLVHSGGGSISAEEAVGTPIVLAESGPAAGAVAALTVCRAMGIEHAVTCDMGGTSYDVSTITSGHLSRRRRGVLMGIWTALSMVDIESASAGGGSLGWTDALGLLRVGPRSAGAVPGPACYGRGGTVATVTDALVVLGYIDPAGFVGGRMQLDAELARAACAVVAEQLGCDTTEAAWGIREVAQAEMTNALRSQLAERGLDPAQHTMISFGGCGGLFAWDIAQSLGVQRVVAPEMSSVLSAFGAATADIRRERGHAVSQPLPAERGELDALVKSLVEAVDIDLEADGVPLDRRAVHFELDLRFSRQKHEITMVVEEALSIEAQQKLVEDFHAEYQRRYGAGALGGGAPTEVAAIRAIGVGRTVRAELRTWPQGDAAPAPVVGHRAVRVARAAAAERVPVIRFDDLRPGHQLIGPALIDSDSTTFWVPDGARATVDERRSIVFERNA